ncbi:MAG: toprim domain-containing protein [Polyangiaceae bacterium]|nr:toprim domain-containing protein [Polyangiaceae bacterium]
MIAPETVAAVKERTNIVALIGENTRLQKRGRSHVGLCPFHKEKTPSFHVNAERGFFHCFGCGVAGTAVDYLMKLEGLDFPEAVRSLAERCGVVVEENRTPVERAAAERRRREIDDLYALNELAAAYFESALERHPLGGHARAELAKRGLDGAEAAPALAAFRVGYAPFGWDGLAAHLRKEGGSVSAAEQLGLLVPRKRGPGHYDRFRHRLMFAVVDLRGRVVAFSGRLLADPSADECRALGLAPNVPPPVANPAEAPAPAAKYINSPESPIYAKGHTVFGLYQARQAIRERGRAVLVEGNFDVLALHARGLCEVVAPLGTAFTVEQARLIKRYTPTVVLMFDGDAAGRKATVAARQPLAAAGLMGKVAVMPAGKDPDDVARTLGVQAVERAVGAARGLLDHLIDAALRGEGFSGSSLSEKQQRIRAVADLLSSENDPELRSMAKAYADRLSAELVIDGKAPASLGELERLIERSLSPAGPGRAEASGRVAGAAGERTGGLAGPASRSAPRVAEIGLRVLGVLLDQPELCDDPDIGEALTDLDGDVALGVAALREMWDSKRRIEPAELLDLLPSTIHPFAVGRLAAPAWDAIAEAKTELLENAAKLRRRAWSREKAHLVDELSRAGAVGDQAAEDDLLRELLRRSRSKLGRRT